MKMNKKAAKYPAFLEKICKDDKSILDNLREHGIDLDELENSIKSHKAWKQRTKK